MIKVILWFFDIVLVLIIAMGFMRDAYGWCIEDPDENAKIDAALDWHYLDGVTLTAYCNCPECCGQWS
ncbi:MAG: hypothetical protein KBS74_06770, partial [Clostridiales bacterium]|nr:hypothetical protein [Candidatus Cacconaster stercorequi]